MTAITRYLQHKRDTAANWALNNPVILAGQFAFTTDVFYTGTDQPKFKVGDGVQTWSQLDYMPLGSGSNTFSNGLTENAGAVKLGGALTQNTEITGNFELKHGTTADPLSVHEVNTDDHFEHKSGSASVYAEDGQLILSANTTKIDVFENGTAITSNGSNNRLKVTDADGSKGLVYAADYSSNFTPESLISKRWVTDQYGIANGIAPLDGSSKISTAYLPAIALTDVFVVASQVAQLALAAEEGDVAVRTDINTSYIHNGGVSGTMADWQELLVPGQVTSVNGLTGAVTLTGTANRLTVSPANVFDISASYVGQSSITTLGTITSGTWNATSISTTYTDAKIKGSISVNQVAFGSASDTITGSSSLTWDGTILTVGGNANVNITGTNSSPRITITGTGGTGQGIQVSTGTGTSINAIGSNVLLRTAYNVALGSSVRDIVVHSSGTGTSNSSGAGMASMWEMRNASGTLLTTGRLSHALNDATNGAEYSDFRFETLTNNTLSEKFRITPYGVRLTNGSAPGSPVNGDIWFDGTDIKIRIAGATKTFTVT